MCGRIDAVEMQALTPGVDGPSIREWYRFLACGYRLPGRGRHRQDVGRGAGRGDPDLRPTRPERPLSFAGFAEAVRAGRTFVSSGALIDIEVDGHGPGDVVDLGCTGRHASRSGCGAWAAQPVIERSS